MSVTTYSETTTSTNSNTISNTSITPLSSLSSTIQTISHPYNLRERASSKSFQLLLNIIEGVLSLDFFNPCLFFECSVNKKMNDTDCKFLATSSNTNYQLTKYGA